MKVLQIGKKSAKKNQENNNRDRSKCLLTKKTPFAVKESYVKLRTNLMFSLCADGEKSCKVFAITSSNPSEGKSITAANVAVSFAMLGKRTLLVDADMRKPMQHKLWNVKTSYGLSDLLARVDTCKVFRVDELPLSVICVGNIPPNPSELLASANMLKFLECARQEYDYVIVDTPPFNTVADAQILSKAVDGTVLVVRAGETKSTDVSYALELLKQNNVNVCGIVLNDVDIKSGKYSYNYKYRYKYEQKEYGY